VVATSTAERGRYATVCPPAVQSACHFKILDPPLGMDLTQNANYPTAIVDNLKRIFYDRMSFLTPIVEYLSCGSDLTSAKQSSEEC